MILSDSILTRPGPLAHLLLADPDAPSPVPEGRAVRNTIPVIVADAVAESFFAAWPVEEFDLRRDLGDLTPRLAHCFVEFGRPTRIISSARGVRTSAHLPRRWGWRVSAVGRGDLAAHLARGPGSGGRYRDAFERFAASGRVDVAAVARALDAADPFSAGRGLDGHGAAALTAAGIDREFHLLRAPDASGREAGRLGWLLHAGLVIDDGDRVGGPVATADIPLGRDGHLLLPPLVDTRIGQVGFPTGIDPDRAAAEYGKLVMSLLFPALLALAYLNRAGVTLRPRESGRGLARCYILDVGQLIGPTRN